MAGRVGQRFFRNAPEKPRPAIFIDRPARCFSAAVTHTVPGSPRAPCQAGLSMTNRGLLTRGCQARLVAVSRNRHLVDSAEPV